MLWYFYRNNQSSSYQSSLSDLYIGANIKLQTPTSKSLPNTPKNEQVQVQQTRMRACSAVVNAKHRTKDDFHGLDAYLERKQMEKHGMYLTSENHSDDETREEESYFEYQVPNVPNRADARLHLSDDNYRDSPAFSTQNEGKPKSLSGQYQETFKLKLKKFSLLENNFVKLL